MFVREWSIAVLACGWTALIVGPAWAADPMPVAQPVVSDGKSMQERSSDFHSRADQLDLNQLEESLNEVDKLSLVFSAGMTGGIMDPPSHMAQLLADFRIDRLRAALQQLPPAEAAARVERLFNRNLRLHREELVQCIARMRGRSPSRSATIVSGNAHALSASLLLCALHCDRAVFLKKLDAWQGTIGPLVTQCTWDPELAPIHMHMGGDGLPQRLLVLNLFVLILERDTHLDVAAIERRCAFRLPNFPRSSPFWVGPPGRQPGVSPVGQPVRTYFSVARGWGSAALFSDEFRQDAILAAVRTLVEDIGKPKF